MLKKLVVFAICLLFLSQAQIFAGDKKPDMGDVEKNLKETFPKFAITDIKESALEGLYEVTAGDMVFYFSPKGYLFFGEIWTKDGKNLTAEKRERIALVKIQSKLDEIKKLAVRLGPEDAKITVIEVSDPDCPYCRKASAFFNDKKDIARYVIFSPLVQIHPDATMKSMHILCSSSQAQAYKEVYGGAAVPQLSEQCKDKSASVMAAHNKIAAELGVKGVPAFWILNGDKKKVRHVSGANIPQITETLKNFQGEKAK